MYQFLSFIVLLSYVILCEHKASAQGYSYEASTVDNAFRFQEQIKNLEKNNTDLQEKIVVLELQIKTLERNNTDCEGRNTNSEMTIANLRGQITVFETVLKSLTDRITILESTPRKIDIYNKLVSY